MTNALHTTDAPMAASSSSPTAGLYGNGDAENALRLVALQAKPTVVLEAEEYYVGVLQHDKPPTPEGFFWFKVKAVSLLSDLRILPQLTHL